MATKNTTKPIFSGRYVHALDPKNRITIPADWRETDHDPYYIIPREKTGCLVAMSPEEFQAMRAKAEAREGMSPQKRRIFIREFYSRAERCVTDKQGRLLLPVDHCKKIGLEEGVILLGTDTSFEIWNPKRREESQPVHDAVFDEMADEMEL